ncbi:MAG: hypothetical protein R8P61_37110 [Bacteroidia bacterium]|nr:hypothetical protein [Bacteroidia bacterium]
MFFENKTGKYLLYALGEISLIIIGVMIALTVSEWNNNHTDGAYEREMLTLIKRT